jgi:hypothetical protein
MSHAADLDRWLHEEEDDEDSYSEISRRARAEEIAQELGIDVPGYELDKEAVNEEQRAREEDERERRERAKEEAESIRAEAEKRADVLEREARIDRETQRVLEERKI